MTVVDGRIVVEIIPVLLVACQPDRPRYETVAAIRADIFKRLINARSTEGAFVDADTCFERCRRQGLVAVFAAVPQLEQGLSLFEYATNTKAPPGQRRNGAFDAIQPVIKTCAARH